MNNRYFFKNRYLANAASVAFGLVCLACMNPVYAEFDLEFSPDTVIIKYDAKTYPGISCEAQATSETGSFSNLGFAMANANQGRRHVVCPIVRDNTENNTGTFSVLVHVYNPPERTLNCTLFSIDQFDSIIDSNTDSTSVLGNQTLYIDVDSSVEGGFFGINCRLPTGGMVYSYEVREFLETDNEGGLNLLP